jgi:cell division protein FtsB
MLKRHFKRGSAEIVSVVLLVVVLGGLAIGISGGLANSTKANAKAGNEANNTQLEQTYNNIKSEISD